MVYFHNPKFTRQQQLPLEEMAQSAINTLPLFTQLFPQIKVYYDDDAQIPLLCQEDAQQSGAAAVSPLSHALEPNADCKPPADHRGICAASAASAPRRGAGRAKHAWLVCCSSVFLLAAGVVWASSDQSLLPLIAMVLSDDPPAQEAQRPPADLSAAHGHVSLMD